MAAHADKQWQEEARDLWFQIQAEYELDAEQLVILRVTVDQYSRFTQAKKQLNADGLVIMGKTTMRAHPAAAIEKVAYKNFLAGLKMLGINAPQETSNMGRPSTAKLIGL